MEGKVTESRKPVVNVQAVPRQTMGTETRPLILDEPCDRQISAAYVDTAGLDQSLAAGLAWTAGAKWASQLISWGALLLVTRLLSPSDFGLAGMAALYSGLLLVVSDALGTAVTTFRELPAEALGQLNSLAALGGCLAWLLSLAAAIPLARFFRSPHLAPVIVVTSATLAASGLRIVPYGLLYRGMRFRLLSAFDAAQAVTQAVVTLALAWRGFGYWSLVLGNVAGAVALAALQIVARPCGFRWPRMNALRAPLQFSRHIMISSLSWYGYSNADFLVAGRVLGQAALGAYTIAWTLATIPLEKVTAIVNNVTFAYLAAAQNDDAALRRYLRVITEGLSLVTFPATIGLGLAARDFIPLLLGSKWESAIMPLEILAVYASFRCVVTLLPSILNVTGESRYAMRVTQGGLLLMPAAFYAGSRWGPAGIAWGWVAAYPVIAACLYRRALRRIAMGWREYVGALRPALAGCCGMVVAVEFVKIGLSGRAPLPILFACEVAGGALAYLGTLLMLHRDRLFVFWKFARAMRNPAGANKIVEALPRG